MCLRLQEDPPAGVSGAPTDNNIMLWNAVIFGYVDWQYRVLFLICTAFSVAFDMALKCHFFFILLVSPLEPFISLHLSHTV